MTINTNGDLFERRERKAVIMESEPRSDFADTRNTLNHIFGVDEPPSDIQSNLETVSNVTLPGSLNLHEEKIRQKRGCVCPYLQYSQSQLERVPVQVNPVNMITTELSPEEVTLFRRKWAHVTNDLTNWGSLVLIRILATDGETAKKLGIEPGTEIDGRIVYDEQLVKCGTQLAQYIDFMVNNLDKPKTINTTAFDIGRKKIGIVNDEPVTRREARIIRKAMLQVLQTYYPLGNVPGMSDALNKTLKIALGIWEDATHWNDRGQR